MPSDLYFWVCGLFVFQIQLAGGLVNHLQGITMFYQYRGKKRFQILWEKNPADCPADFAELFMPLPAGCTVVSKHVSKPHFLYITPPGEAKRTQLPRRKVLALQDPFHQDWYDETEFFLTLFHPLPHIQAKIDAVKAELGHSYIAVHLRRTDLLKAHQSGASWVGSDFDDMKAVGWAKPYDLPIYVASDNEVSLNTMKEHLGDRVFSHSTYSNPDTLRHTSVEDAVVDLWVCFDALHFRGTNSSSFSVLIDNVIRYKQSLSNP